MPRQSAKITGILVAPRKPAKSNRDRALRRLSDALRDLASAQVFLRRAGFPGWIQDNVYAVETTLRGLRMAAEELKS